MTRLIWDAYSDRSVEHGVDRGVFFLKDSVGEPWDGLISVDEVLEGFGARPLYQDGVMTDVSQQSGVFNARIAAFTYPDALDELREEFDFSYRTKVQTSDSRVETYKLHLVYNAVVIPSEKAYASNVPISTFSWDVTTTPMYIPGARPASHLVIESDKTETAKLRAIEDILYGTTTTSPRMPTVEQLVRTFGFGMLMEIIDNQDGTFTARGPEDMVTSLTLDTFRISANSVLVVDEDYFIVSSQ